MHLPGSGLQAGLPLLLAPGNCVVKMRIVHLFREEHGSLERCGVPEVVPLQVSPHEQFPHPGSCGQRLEVGDPLARKGDPISAVSSRRAPTDRASNR